MKNNTKNEKIVFEVKDTKGGLVVLKHEIDTKSHLPKNKKRRV